jgi:hypothetical protein
VSLASQMYFIFTEQSASSRVAEVLSILIEMQFSEFSLLSGCPVAHFAVLLRTNLFTVHHPKTPSQSRSEPEVQYSPSLS